MPGEQVQSWSRGSESHALFSIDAKPAPIVAVGVYAEGHAGLSELYHPAAGRCSLRLSEDETRSWGTAGDPGPMLDAVGGIVDKCTGARGICGTGLSATRVPKMLVTVFGGLISAAS